MKKIIKPILISLLLMLITSIGFFMSSYSLESSKVKADISGISGEIINLTTTFGTTPTNYFKDSDNNSTLVGAKVPDKEVKYHNEQGEYVSSYYVVQGDSSGTSSKFSYGYATFNLTEEMKKFANKGILYVQASAGIISKKDDAKSNIQIRIIQGDNVAESKSDSSKNGINIEQWTKTDFIQVSGDKEITFYFTSLERGTGLNKCDFTIVEPKLVFKTIIDNIEITDTTEVVAPGQILKLQAMNEVLEISGTSNYMKYYRNLHRAEYEIVEGAQFGEIIDGYLYVTSENIDGTISIRAKSRKDSLDGGYIYSEIKQYRICTEKFDVSIQSDFNDPAEFYGTGTFNVGQRTTLTVIPKENFEFISWQINGVEYKTKKVVYTVGEENNIKCNLKKNIFVSNVIVEEKVYDGNTDVNCTFILDGVQPGHDVELIGLITKYSSADVGESKHVTYDGYPILSGENAGLYILASTNIPEAQGTIIRKDITIVARNMSKIYGDIDETIPYECDYTSITGKLSRETGENVGDYLINIGDLNEKNPNYNCQLSSQYYYTINKRDVSIGTIEIVTKTYDKKYDAEVKSYTVKNKVESDDLGLDLDVCFLDYNVGEREIKINSVSLTGTSKGNYNLVNTDAIFKGKILPKEINVLAQEGSSIYGDEINLEYIVEGLINGDSLNGNISINGKDAGNYLIQKNTLENPNYAIKFTTANYTINKRSIEIVANELQKTYGENDPILGYDAINIIPGDRLEGSLIREQGEDVGEYIISQGTIAGINYEIVKFASARLKIFKKEIDLEIAITDKIYDGTKQAEYTYLFSGLVGLDTIEFNATMEFESEHAGENIPVVIKNSYYEGEKINNYTIKDIVSELKGSIKRKDVYITVSDKSVTYGDDEVSLEYSVQGLIDDEELEGTLSRREGSDAGKYEILLNTITNENNKNYNIINKKQAYYTILRADIDVKAIRSEKIYGESDPEFQYLIEDSSQLKYNDCEDDIFEGTLSREEGEVPGQYVLKIGTLNCPKNYQIRCFTEEYLIIQKKNITVTANNSSKIYGEEDPTFTYSTNGLINGDKLSINLKREYGENVGNYYITYTSLNDPRYSITFENATFTISPKNITIRADDKYKEYGEEDPSFTISVIGDNLENDDEIENIEQGKMSRFLGENVGEYIIEQGTYSLGGNYIVTFQTGKLTILTINLEITADVISKKYGNKDGELTYTITNGSLKNNDVLGGQLVREEGELPGEYEIQQGSLFANDNYNLSFIPGKFIIEKRPITITADEITKVYGEADPELTYTLSESLIEGDSLIGKLEREKPITSTDDKAYEKTGKYLISSNLYSPNYEVNFVPAYLTIQRREITIVAEDKEKTYGETDPDLTYKITEGTILEGDNLIGEIYRITGENAGAYDIRSNLTLGRNYKINFIKGKFTIKPIDIYVKTFDYEKVYGDITPTFEYEIVSGELLNEDILLGGVSKEEGEEVGKYKLVSAFNNVNYNVILSENYLIIKPKKAYLSVNIQDKVYNGDCVANIKNPVISGLIDEDVKITYEKENCARFISPDVANNVPVIVFGVTLTGDKAKNYEIVYPEGLTANITKDVLQDEDQKIILLAMNNTTLRENVQLKVEDGNVEESGLLSSSKQLVSCYNISLEENNERKELRDSLKIKFEIPREYRDRGNYYIYGKNKNGEYILLSSTRNENYLEVETDFLGEFIILSDNESWIDIGSYISIAIIGAFAIYIIARIIIKQGKKKKKVA